MSKPWKREALKLSFTPFRKNVVAICADIESVYRKQNVEIRILIFNVFLFV